MKLTLLGLIVLLAAAAVIHRSLRRDDGDTPLTLARQVLAGLLIYGLVGPLIGLVIVKLLIPIPQLTWDVDGVQIAYLIGGLPAMMCGVTAGAVKRRPPASASWPRFTLVCASGAVYSFAMLLSIIGVDRMSAAGDAIRAGAIPGLVAAIVCSLLFLRTPAKAG